MFEGYSKRGLVFDLEKNLQYTFNELLIFDMGRNNGYLYSKDEVLKDLKIFIKNYSFSME